MAWPGLLVVDQVIPKGPAHQLLEPGDVLIAVDGDIVLDFVSLEEQLDSHVGQTLTYAALTRNRTCLCVCTSTQVLGSMCVCVCAGGGKMIR
jgi:pro-apoptotic serine protease NMA111